MPCSFTVMTTMNSIKGHSGWKNIFLKQFFITLVAIVGNLYKSHKCIMIFGSNCVPWGKVKIVAESPFLSLFLDCASSSC